MATRPQINSGGVPRWLSVAASGAIVAGAAWAIVSFFLPKPGAVSPPSGAASTAVTVSGNGSVGVGTMSGGQISVGAPAAPASKAGSAP